ncbi:MAG: formyltransferase family protein [Rhodothermales bacterium]|nr:formyltransferase family protein [Rhodothermales bacterium]
MRIAFLCNSEFALSSVDLLAQAGVLAGVACSDGAPHIAAPLASHANALGIPFAVIRKAEIGADLEDWLLATAPDAALVQTFPYRIPAVALNIPRLGFFNLHPGQLPAYRGPDPVFWQLKRQEAVGAVTLHRMTPAFDDGEIVCFESIPIGPDDTYGVHQSLLIDAALRCITPFLQGAIKGTPQDEVGAGYQGRPAATDLTIDWTACDASAVAALARACNPTYGGAIILLRNTMVRLLEAQAVPFSPIPRLPAGTVISAQSGRGLLVLCAGGTVVDLTIVATDEGTFSGGRFAALFGIEIGEKFLLPAFVS